MDNILLFQLVFIGIASAVGAVLTVYDKIASRYARRRRVPEAVLVSFGALGGALLMYIVMRLIRHKTRKPKFYAGFPVMTLLQAALLTALNLWLHK